MPALQKPLVDPNGLGWCKACGYCRSLADIDTKTKKATPEKIEPSALAATGGAVLDLPMWFWVSLFGAIVIVGATIFCERYFRLTELQRALFCTLQIIVALRSCSSVKSTD